MSPHRSCRLARLTCAVALLAAASGCPTPPPPERPRAPTFDAAEAELQLRAEAARLSAPSEARRRATVLRDLAWLLWIHREAGSRAQALFQQALDLAGDRAAPWAAAGRAAWLDLRLEVGPAAEAWARVLREVSRAHRSPEASLDPPPGLSRIALAHLATRRLIAAMHRMAVPWPARRLARIQALPGLPPADRALLALTLARRALRAGARSLADSWRTRAGCPAAVSLSPRFGRWPRQDLFDALAAPAQRSTAAGPRCEIILRSRDGLPGLREVEATFGRPPGGSAQARLLVAWSGPLVVSAGARRLLDPRHEAAPRPRVRWLPVTLPRRGGLRVRLRLPVSASPRTLRLQLVTAPRPAAHAAGAAPTAPNRSGTRVRATLGHRPSRRARIQAAIYAPLGDLLHVARFLGRGLPDAGRGPAAHLARRAPLFTWGLVVRAQLESLDALVPTDLRRARARRLLEKALRTDPGLLRARVELAAVLRDQNRSQRALELLSSPSPRRPVPSAGRRRQDKASRGATHGTLLQGAFRDGQRLLAYARIALQAQLGWRALAMRQAAQLERSYPQWADAARLQLRLASEEDSLARRSAASTLHRLDATDAAWARQLARRGQLRAALVEAQRLVQLRGDPALLRPERARWLRRLGQGQAAVGLLRAHLREAPWDATRRLALADALVSLGRQRAAIAVLRAGRDRYVEQRSVSEALDALGDPNPITALRVSGQAAVRRYRAAHWGPGTRPVYVLDRTALRILPWGGVLTLTHQIVHVRTKEAVRELGEVRLAPGVEVLTLRVLKRDGTTREPQDLGDRRTISLPGLEPGDFIELESVTRAPASPIFPRGGFLAARFRFRSTRAHFFRSELVVVAPAGLKLQIRSWGAVPKPMRLRTAHQQVLTFRASRVPALDLEPRSASLLGPLPTVQVGARVRLADLLRQRRELLWGLDTPSQPVRALARRLCQAGGTARDKARRLLRWVQLHVREAGGIYVSAAHSLARRAGSRLQLLRALLRACRLGRVETLLGRPRQTEPAPVASPTARAAAEARGRPSSARVHPASRGDLPDMGFFSQALLRLRLPGGPLYLLPQLQHAPLGYLPPALAGAQAVCVDRPDAPVFRLPARPDAESRQVSLTVHLARDGSAVVEGEERLRGMLALRFRSALAQVPMRRLRSYLERTFFLQVFAGARLKSLSFGHARDPERPLLLRYRVRVPQLARVEQAGLRLPLALFGSRMSQQVTPLPARRLPLAAGPVGPVRIVATVHLPAGYRVQGPLRSVSLREPFGRFQQTVRTDPRDRTRLRLERLLQVPYQVVPPAHYPALARFSAEVDRAEAQEVLLTRH